MADSSQLWQFSGRKILLGGRPVILGVVNVTPDSFSDGGLFTGTEAAVAHGRRLIAEGADLLDIGGESSRPGARSVPVEEELARVLPVVQRLAAHAAVPLSIDTCKAAVARACLQAGAHIINDITALAGDPEMAAVVREHQAGVIAMHMQGTPATMQREPRYDDVTREVTAFFKERLRVLEDLGIAREQVAIDPGIGFGKTVDHNLELIARLEELQSLGRPVCLGVSRKGFIGKLLNRPVAERLAGSLAALLYARGRGALQLARVHDVAATRDALELFEAIDSHARPSV